MGELNLYVTAHHLVSPLPHAPIGVLCPYRDPLLKDRVSMVMAMLSSPVSCVPQATPDTPVYLSFVYACNHGSPRRLPSLSHLNAAMPFFLLSSPTFFASFPSRPSSGAMFLRVFRFSLHFVP